MKRGLFVELLGGIGDLIFALPAIEALVQTHSDVRWDVFTFESGAELLAGDPRVGEVFGAPKGRPEGDERPYCWHQLAELLGRRAYELLVTDTRHSGIPELIEACGAARRVTQLWRGAGPREPIARLFVRRLREEGFIPVDFPTPPASLVLSEAERQAARDDWASRGQSPSETIVFNPHAGMAIKRWPAASYVALGRVLRSTGWKVDVLAGETPAVAEEIAGEAGASVLAKRPLRETAACLEGVALLISADSGFAHLANAVGAPVVGIYGPTWSGRYGVAAPARNLQSPFDCPERQPMNFTLQRCWYTGQCIFSDKSTCCADISVDTVLKAASELLPPLPKATRRRQSVENGWRGTSPTRQRTKGVLDRHFLPPLRRRRAR